MGGFELNQTAVNMRSPLYAACENGQTEMAIWLIQRFEIDVNLQCDIAHKTALYIAAEKGHTDIVEELIKRPDVDVNKFTAGKKTALYVAIEKGNIDCVRQILKRCKLADLYLETSYSTTPLFIAQKNGEREIMRLMMLVGRKPNPNYESKP
jgi:serine/threonine-protein phosphatase 6 regulatory ankyrin repeat subunit B